MGIVWGFMAALGWGTADFMARDISARIGAYRALLYAHLVSFGCLLLIVAWSPPATLTILALLLGLLLGASNMLGSLLLYRALSIGKIAVVSPIGSSFAAITLALSLLTGDAISWGKVGGLLLTVFGVILASTPTGERAAVTDQPWARGVPEALGCALALGVTFWGLKYVVPTLGPWLPVLESRIATFMLLPVLAKPLRQSIALPSRATWPLVLAVGLIDTGANVAYNLGISSDAPGVVAVLGSLFSPITVLLAFVLLRERLSQRQWIGVALIFAAVAAIGVVE